LTLVATQARSASWWKQRRIALIDLLAGAALLLRMVVRAAAPVGVVVVVDMVPAVVKVDMADEAALGGDGALDPNRGSLSLPHLLIFCAAGSTLRC